MNKNIKEELVFSALMTVGMVVIMLSYNIIIISGFTYGSLWMILQQFIPIFIAAFIVEQFFVSHNVNKIHKMIVSPNDSRFKYIVVMAILMATAMSLSMTLYTSLIYVGTGSTFWHHYLNAWIHNYPIALIAQLVIVGPIVRLARMKLFKQTKIVE